MNAKYVSHFLSSLRLIFYSLKIILLLITFHFLIFLIKVGILIKNTDINKKNLFSFLCLSVKLTN